MIEIDFLTEDTEARRIVERYWETEDGKFVEQIKKLLPFRERTTAKKLVAFMSTISVARDTRVQCPRCGLGKIVRSRADVDGVVHSFKTLCVACNEKEALERAKSQAQATHEMNRLMAERERQSVDAMLDYGDVPDDVVLVLIALEAAISPRLERGTFTLSECRNLAPGATSDLVQKLCRARVLADFPSKAGADAYLVKDGQLWHYPGKVHYGLVPDETLGRGEMLMTVLRERAFDEQEALYQLWLDFAVADCMAYLFDECEAHGLRTSSDEDSEIRSILRTALHKHSVAELWSSIWKIVRDAASLSAREYYNKQKAAATIPGKLKRNLEAVAKGTVTLKLWDRPQHQPQGTLGDVFYDYFGIDERDAGPEVASKLPMRTDEIDDSDFPTSSLSEVAHRLMERAVAHGISGAVLASFAEQIQMGLDVEGAVEAVFDIHPVLLDPL